MAILVSRCDKARTCAECVALQDPYCAWNVREDKCRGAQSWAKGSQGDYLQSVATGQHKQCPDGAPLSPPALLPDHAGRLGTVINQVTNTAMDTKDHGHGGDTSGHSSSGNSLMSGSDDPTIEASVVLFSLETLIITVSAGAVAALVVGFVTG